MKRKKSKNSGLELKFGHTGILIFAFLLLTFAFPDMALAQTAITNVTELQNMKNNLTADYYLANDIDASATSGWNGGDGFEPVGTNNNEFTGTLDGQGYKITGLYINRPSTYDVGLFGEGGGAEIKNVGLENANVTGYQRVGCFFGGTYPLGVTITNCYSTGSANGNDAIGGLIGDCYQSTINNSYSTAVATRRDEYDAVNSGGLIGHCRLTTVTNCYATGSADWGGLLGRIFDATVINCYSTGSAGWGGLIGFQQCGATVTNSYWDTETSGQSSSCGGTGKTTAEMKTQSTFTDAGWNFTTIWEMIGYNYPRLINNPDPTLPVILSLFTAQYLDEQAQLSWQTQTESDNMGWNVYRNSESDFNSAIRINDELIPGHGTTTQQHDYEYEDTNGQFESGDDYWYWLESVDYSGKAHHYDRVAIMHISEGQEPEPTVVFPQKYGLQFGPNPFNSNLTIGYMLRKSDMVRVEIYNIHGNLLAEFNEGQSTEDISYTLKWNGQDLSGKDVSSGVLLIKLITTEGSETKKAILVR